MHLTFLSISVDFMVSILLLLMVRKKNEENNLCHLQSNSHTPKYLAGYDLRFRIENCGEARKTAHKTKVICVLHVAFQTSDDNQ